LELAGLAVKEDEDEDKETFLIGERDIREADKKGCLWFIKRIIDRFIV